MTEAKGSITVADKSVDFSIKKGTMGPDVLDIRSLYSETGMFTYDPGFTSTASCESKITFIDGDEGVLLYRGYPIQQTRRARRFSGDLLPSALWRTADRRAEGGFRLPHHPPHHDS